MQNYKDLEVAYQQMAQDEEREAEALEWAEAAIMTTKDGDDGQHSV